MSTPPEGRADELPDGQGVMLLEVFWCGQGRSHPDDRLCGKRQDLEAGTIESDQVLVEQTVADLDELVRGELERGADSIIGIVADPVAVAREHQEQVERAPCILHSARYQVCTAEFPAHRAEGQA